MSTTGIELNTRRRGLAEVVELVSSMRFAISMLTVIAIASMIGTVMQQNAAMTSYVNQFGPFWFAVFDHLGLYAVYSAWWFLVILGLLITSTALCIVRNAPRMLRDMKSWRLNVREQSLRNFHHKSEWTAALTPAALAAQCAERLRHAGYGTKIVEKENGILVAAKRGAFNKFGYIFAHSAIIVILLGGVLDSDLPIRFQQWFLHKEPYAGGGLISAIPEKHRLTLSNPTYRANLRISEGQTGDIAIIPQASGALLQPLPFTVKLEKFHIDFYTTGMPKLFASDVTVRDHETGQTVHATIKVNEPLIYKGVAVYQSSFEDGGTRLKVSGYPMAGTDTAPFTMTGEVGGEASKLTRGDEQFDVEWSDFRPFNVENTGTQDARAVTKGEGLSEQLAHGLDKHSGSAAKNVNNKDLKNIGPSLQYKLRDKTGQAREFNNYMQPVTLDGELVFLAGVRASPNDPFNYLRIPADDAYTVKEFMRLRAALADPALRKLAGSRYARRALPPGATAAQGALSGQLEQSAARTLDVFADGGFRAIAAFLEKIPKDEQEKALPIFMKILNGSMWELWQGAREKDGLAPAEATEAHGRFLQMATNAVSDSFLYGAPVYLQLDSFTEVKASVLQVTRSPGKSVVYLGCLLLVLGVFSMFYIPERRLWVWLRKGDGGEGGAHALMAMSTQRKTLDFEREFNALKAKLPQSA